MAVLPILKYGDPRLLIKSEDYPIEHIGSPDFVKLVSDMFDTMEANDGAGLAAPQIGVNKRVIVYGINSNKRYPDAPYIPQKVLINPYYQPLTGLDVQSNWESCLSTPGLKGKVPRFDKIRYNAFDSSGQPFTQIAQGFHALVLQHEIDHLDGLLYPMRVADMTQFGFIDAF